MAVKFIIKTHDARGLIEYYQYEYGNGLLMLGGLRMSTPFDSYEEAQAKVEELIAKFDFYIYQIEKVFYKPV